MLSKLSTQYLAALVWVKLIVMFQIFLTFHWSAKRSLPTMSG